MSKLVRSISAVVLSGIAVAVAGSASAAHNGYSGALCNPLNSTEAGRIAYNQNGVHNTSGTLAKVECGALPTVGSDIFAVDATVYDRSLSADVCCDFRVLNNDGSAIALARKCTNGFSSAPLPLNWVPPVNAAGSFDMTCDIPGVASGQFSHVTTYRLQTNP